jgi:hypothetical protein
MKNTMKNLRTAVTGTSLLLGLLLVLPTACDAQSQRPARKEAASKPNNPPAKLTVQDTSINRDVRAPISFSPVIRKNQPRGCEHLLNHHHTGTAHGKSPVDG